jgi:peptidoglycan/LPS O-acetylase OafA/YrhL
VGKKVEQLHYRPDIDGLRAVAVIPVVLFHAGVPIFGGGYVGVDVFFVISGYLITSIIAAEIDRGSFSIFGFYQRRIRRIFPVLVVVMSFCVAVGYLIFAPSDFQSLGKSVLAASLFVSNIFFWKEVGYFEAPASEKPLLHTWSLAIEEQFYLFFPVFLYLLSRHFRRIRTPATVAICLLSFMAATILVNYHPSATFFLGFSRAWELLVGCLLALGVVRPLRNPIANSAAAFVGLVLVVAPIFLYSSLTRFPGASALPPVIGTALLILSGQTNPTRVHFVLSTSPFTAVGKASYSLYLWHYPLLAFGKYVTLGKPDGDAIAVICLVSIIISFLSLQFVERPFRAPSRSFRIGRTITVGAVCMAFLAATGGFIDLDQGLSMRLDLTSKRLMDSERDKYRHHMQCLSLENKIVTPQQACKLGARDVQPNILLWGDSHAVVTATALESAAIRRHSAFLLAASVDCPIGIGFSINTHGAPAFVRTPGYRYCGHYNSAMLNFAIQHPSLKIIVLSSRWSNWRIGEPGSPAETPVDIRLRDFTGIAISPQDNKRIFAHGFESLIQKLTAAGKTIWIVGPIPLPKVRVPQALFIKHLGFTTSGFDVSRAAFRKQNQWILSFFGKIAKRYPVHFIWPDIALCSQEICPVSEGGRPIYFDDNHLSIFGAEKTSYLYDVIFEKIGSKMTFY